MIIFKSSVIFSDAFTSFSSLLYSFASKISPHSLMMRSGSCDRQMLRRFCSDFSLSCRQKTPCRTFTTKLVKDVMETHLYCTNSVNYQHSAERDPDEHQEKVGSAVKTCSSKVVIANLQPSWLFANKAVTHNTDGYSCCCRWSV